jgi:hypothetical protein
MHHHSWLIVLVKGAKSENNGKVHEGALLEVLPGTFLEAY